MANWKNLAKKALLSDGRIDEKETKIIREELFADDKIDRSELEFLFDLRKNATGTVRLFNQLFFEAVTKNILQDGSISDAEAKWLRKMIFADGTVDEDEKKLMEDLKKNAKSTCPAFEGLYAEMMATAPKA